MIRVLLAEDMHMVRGALSALLELEPDLEVVAEVPRGDAVAQAALAHRPDVAVLDLHMPGADGLAAAGQLARSLPECRVLILTAQGRPEALRSALAARVGGFILKDAPPEELADAVRRVAAGEHVIDPSLRRGDHRRPQPAHPARDRCAAAGRGRSGTRRDRRGVASVARHGANYLATAVTKLDARNRLDAVRIARDRGRLAAG